MGISVVIRSKDSSKLKETIESVVLGSDCEFDIIVLDSSSLPLKLKSRSNLNVIRLPASDYNDMFVKRKIAEKYVTHDKVLTLDSDQIIEKGLLDELDKSNADATIIPERSDTRNIVGNLLDKKRVFYEAIAKRNPNPRFLAIPRLYRTSIYSEAIKRIPLGVMKYTMAHEDSVLYYEAFNEIKSIVFSDRCIYNFDPPLLSYLKKSYKIGGYNGKATSTRGYPLKYKMLLKELNLRRHIYDKDLGLNIGLTLDAIRFPFIASGYLISSINLRLSALGQQSDHSESE